MFILYQLMYDYAYLFHPLFILFICSLILYTYLMYVLCSPKLISYLMIRTKPKQTFNTIVREYIHSFKSPYPELLVQTPYPILIGSLGPKYIFGPKSTQNLCVVLGFLVFSGPFLDFYFFFSNQWQHMLMAFLCPEISKIKSAKKILSQKARKLLAQYSTLL